MFVGWDSSNLKVVTDADGRPCWGCCTAATVACPECTNPAAERVWIRFADLVECDGCKYFYTHPTIAYDGSFIRKYRTLNLANVLNDTWWPLDLVVIDLDGEPIWCDWKATFDLGVVESLYLYEYHGPDAGVCTNNNMVARRWFGDMTITVHRYTTYITVSLLFRFFADKAQYTSRATPPTPYHSFQTETRFTPAAGSCVCIENASPIFPVSQYCYDNYTQAVDLEDLTGSYEFDGSLYNNGPVEMNDLIVSITDNGGCLT